MTPSMKPKPLAMILLCSSLLPQSFGAEDIFYSGTIKVTNEAPMQGTCMTPVWIGFHDGTFDTYDRGAPLSSAMERLAEDGNNGPISQMFAGAAGTAFDVNVGMAPICPGQSAELEVKFSVQAGKSYYASYASMVLPSNDAFVANGNPMAHKVVNDAGEFIEVDIDIMGSAVLDAGTEINDELPANTAFFGQAAPDTGVDENGVVTTHPGFLPAQSGGILSSPEFAMADFTAPGYQVLSISLRAERVFLKEGTIKVANEAPADGTCQTPVWVAIHDGTFDTYDRGVAISEPMERLAEDGNNAPIIGAFADAPGGLWDGVVGMAPLCPGDEAELPFAVLVKPDESYYFSYASMVLPSNDAFVANGNPTAHPIIVDGDFVDVDFMVSGGQVLDAGSEVNDELPETTAFFGQMAPDTGTDENGVVELHPGFNARGSGGILDSDRFANADFTGDGYNMLSFNVVPRFPYGFIVSMIDANTAWCLSATDSSSNGNLGFRPCDFDEKPAYQLWKFDAQGRVFSAIEESRCMRVGFGNTIFDGVRMRLGDCSGDLMYFEIDSANTQFLKVLGAGDGYCITNRGGNANTSDTIHAKPCPSRLLDDYQWEFYAA